VILYFKGCDSCKVLKYHIVHKSRPVHQNKNSSFLISFNHLTIHLDLLYKVEPKTKISTKTKALIMTILLTGGTGKTSLRLASLLHSASIPVLLTSRRGPTVSSTHPIVQFDWNIPSTWNNPFTTSPDISAVYLLSGELSDPAPVLKAFIDFAIEKGVRRFVLCSGSSCEYGGPFHGKIWQKLDEAKIEFAVLRPSWFMGISLLLTSSSMDNTDISPTQTENLSEPGHGHFETITQHNKLFTACADGKIPWVSADDIAAVAFRALTDDKPHDCAYRILGPELLTYDEV
jgi:festuclavine dehydrogenase